MGQRLELQSLLEALLGSDKVYFQPPGSQTLSYPAIVYKLDDIDAVHADNAPYKLTDRYQVTVIDRNPDSPIRDKIKFLPACAFNRHYVANNLNHFVFTLYF